MRSYLAFALFASACTSASPSGTETFESVRDRLSDAPTRLFIAGAESTGDITARRWTEGGWIEGDTAITVDNGELIASVDSSGKLSVAKLEISIAPIEIPEEVFKKPAQLSDVRIKLAKPITETMTWASDDEATATLTLALDLDWAIAVSGGKTPLGTQHLPPITVDVMVSGDADHVDASLGLHAEGELWSWAGLLELTRLDLALSASTVD